MTKPNLFIVGAMKAGTRTLHAVLAEHPQIFMCEPQEPTRFVDGARLARLWPRMHELGYWRDEQRYLALFERAGAARVIGESSTNYAKLPWSGEVATRIRDFAPDARIVYLMREPAARAVSHYWHAVMYDGEMREPASALRGPGIYRDVSHYAMQLEPFLAAFGRDRVYALSIERFDAEPAHEYRALLQWLGVDADFVSARLQQRQHVRPEVLWQPRTAWLARWMNRYEVLRDNRAPNLPRRRRFYRHLLMRPRRPTAVDLSRVVAELSTAMAPEVQALEALLERRFPEWQA